jgi:hypothetical protein
MKTIKLLSAASVAMLALGCASAGLSSSSAAAQGYGAPPPPPPSYAPPPPPSYRPPPKYDVPDQSVLKACKVAGEGVKVGEPYAYSATPKGKELSVNIPAGPGPGGWCQIIGVYPVGTQVELREYIPSGYGIQSIRVEPSGAEVSQNIEQGRVLVNLGPGVTEVTVINIETRPGWIEICKDGGRPGTDYSFTFIGINGPETWTVRSKACTPAIQVPSGNLVITESTPQEMTGGLAWPANRLVGTNTAQGQITVYIPAGGTIATQTIITFQNKERKGGY